MPKAQNIRATRRRRQRLLDRTSGQFGNRSRLARYAKLADMKGGQYAYRDRRRKKTEFRNLWIVRINAAVRAEGMTYSRFMAGLKAANILLDRKALSELAIHDEAAFKALIGKARAALPA